MRVPGRDDRLVDPLPEEYGHPEGIPTLREVLIIIAVGVLIGWCLGVVGR